MIRFSFIIIAILFSVLVSKDINFKTLTAGENKENNYKNTKKSMDTNKDRKIDIIENWNKSGILVERKEDLNFDGKFNKLTFYNQKGKTIIKYDKNHDGKIDWLEIRDLQFGFKATKIKADRNHDGTFEFLKTFKDIYQTEKRKSHAAEPCLDENISSIEVNLKQVSKELLKSNQIHKFQSFLIDNACYVKYGEKRFKNIISALITEKKACLQDLNSPPTRKHIFKIESLLQNKKIPPKILCNETTYNWENTKGHATVPGDKDHPLISLNPIDGPSYKDEELKSLVFHELFHNTGSMHGRTIEYPYGCETCCNKSIKDKILKSLGCKICKTPDIDLDNEQYAKNITEFFTRSKKFSLLKNYLDTYVKLKGFDRFAFLRLTKALEKTDKTGLLSLLAYEKFQKEHGAVLKNESIYKPNDKKISDSEIKFLTSSKLLLEAQIAIYKGDLKKGEESLTFLKSAKKELEKEHEKYTRNLAWDILLGYSDLFQNTKDNSYDEKFKSAYKKLID